jgi:hypothetical protein
MYPKSTLYWRIVPQFNDCFQIFTTNSNGMNVAEGECVRGKLAVVDYFCRSPQAGFLQQRNNVIVAPESPTGE